MIKYIIFILMFFNVSISYAASDTQLNGCLQELAKQVKNQYSIDLSNISVKVNWESTNVDASKYKKSTRIDLGKRTFSDVLVSNPTTKWCEYSYDESSSYCEDNYSKVFFAKRNNIWTIKVSPGVEWSWYWVATEFITWGPKIWFQFPIKKRHDPQLSDWTYYDEWDDYWQLRKNIVYVQYLLDWTLSSCWFIKFKALWRHTLNDLYQRNYLWNKFEWWSFEDLWKDASWKYDSMKVRIQWLDTDNKDLFQMDVLSVSYNNKSSFFNQFVAHNYQIKAMTDVKNMDWAQSMNKVMNTYKNYLIDDTCFRLIHPDISTLPNFCHGSYSDNYKLAYNTLRWIKSWFVRMLSNIFFSKVYAFSVKPEDKKIALEKMNSLPAPTNNWVSIYTRRKISNLKNIELKNSLIRALSIWTRAMIEKKIKAGKFVSDDDLVFLHSSLNHEQIVKNVEYIFKHYYHNWKLDLSNVEYLNPEFWDSVIPFPDKRHKDKLIENSFLENKLNFIKRKFWDKTVKIYEEKINKIKTKYLPKLTELKDKYNNLIIENKREEAKKISDKISNIYNDMQNEINNIGKNNPEFKKYILLKSKALSNVPLKTIYESNGHKNNKLIFILIWLWILLIIASLYLIYKKNKNENKN